MTRKHIIPGLFIILLFGSLYAQQGIKGEYFNGVDFNTKLATRIDAKIDFSWNDDPPVPGLNPHRCSIRWTGRLEAPESGTYTFSARVDDGIRVWVGNINVIDNWGLNDEGNFTGRVILKKGEQYDLKTEYFNGLIEGEIRLYWTLPSGKQPELIGSQYYRQTPVRKVQPAPVPPIEKEKTPIAKVQPKQKPAPKKTPPKMVATQPAVVDADTLEKYIPANVFFEKGKSVILPESFDELNELATFLKRNSNLQLTIEGHTDVIGDRLKNLALSEDRAKNVAKYLEDKGISNSRIQTVGYGSTRPLVNNHTKEGNEKNRRVVFSLR